MQLSTLDHFDFKSDQEFSKRFAHDYLRQYYTQRRAVSDDEKEVFRFIRRTLSGLPKFERAIEIGCGPTMHHAIMIAPYVKSLVMADYLQENLNFVASWLKNDADAWDWRQYTEYCLREQMGDETPESRETLTRGLVGSVRTVNLLNSNPLGVKSPEQYDLVAAFYCTEEIALTRERWKEVITTITSLIKPGGYLLMSCLKDTDFYHVAISPGLTQSLPCSN